MTQALYLKWRPRDWEEVVGQEHVIQTLRNAVRGERVRHAYLFAGSRGTGKTSTARLLAKAVNCAAESPAARPCNECSHCEAINRGRYLDLIEIDAASNTSVEDVRELRDRINFAPNEGRFKVYIIDEVHMLSTAAFNALLKTLEEPPAHAIFILATTEVHKIPATVLSRCQRHEFRRLPVATILDYIAEKAHEEGLEVEDQALALIARQATGSLRDAISLLDQLTSTGERVTLEQARQVFGTVAGDAVREVVSALQRGEAGAGLRAINGTIDRGADPRQFARQIVDRLRDLLMIRMGNAQMVARRAGEREALTEQAGSFTTSHLLGAIKAFSNAESQKRSSWLPGLALEIAFLEALGGAEAPVEEPPARVEGAANPVASPPAPEPEPKGNPPDSGQGEAPEAPSEGAPLSFQAFRDRWRAILRAARQQDPRIQGLLNSCKPLGVERDALVIGFRSDLLREKMEKRENLRKAREAIREVMGSEVGIRCVLVGSGGSPRGQYGAAPPMEDDGMVATAVRDLGAEVIEVRSTNPDSTPSAD